MDYEPTLDPWEKYKNCLDLLNILWSYYMDIAVLVSARNSFYDDLSWCKNSLKIGFVAVELTELSFQQNRSKITIFILIHIIS